MSCSQLNPLKHQYPLTKISLPIWCQLLLDMTSNQSFMYSVLLGINTAVPNQYLKLTKIDYEGGNELIVFGMSTNDGNILKFIENLTKVEVIDKASLVSMTVETISEQTLKSFTIKCNLTSQQTIDNREEKDGN